MIKTKSSLQLPLKYRFRYSPGWWSSCTSTKPNQNNLSRQAPLFQQEADEKVIPQQANQTLWLFHIRQDQTLLLFFVAVPSVIPQCIKSQSCNTEDGKWKYSLTHYPTTTTNNYPLVRFRCLNVKMTREFGWYGITRWQESYSTSPIPPSYLVVWFVLFVITNATVIFGCLVYLVCHQPSSPSYLVVWFVLFVINQFHRHIWLFSVLPKEVNTSVQVHWQQCWPLMLF